MRHQVIMKLSRKEQVIGENRTVDIIIPIPTPIIVSRSITVYMWTHLGTNGLLMDAAEH